uniref:NADH-ubiquinone oxidoreductase chain 3 n=1 Tax=Corythucha ciliata TaxID=369451 RepID=V5JF78_CORCT|nr:NADH dehydrogenase subunit 3 [Corythucha ciliata]AGM48382.1 NADH dehydrogenase subunit 3 [Corythucha ciliata]
MIKSMMMMLATLTISTIMIISHMIINKKMIMERNKMTPFECGFDPKSSSRLPFSTQFFLIGILFLIFDVEMVMILPMIITLKSSNMTLWFMTSYMVITILITGLYYEWKNGVIEWMN